MEMKNITLKNKDIYSGIDEKNIDLINLDLPEPWQALNSVIEALKVGGYLVSYVPTIPQVMDLVQGITNQKRLLHIKTIEILEREWEIDHRKVRPKTQGIGHSGFLTFARKIA